MLTLLAGASVVVSVGCTGSPSTELETARKACRELSALAEPYARQAAIPPFDLLAPTTAPEQWRKDAQALTEAAAPLKEFGGTRLPEFGQRWDAFAQYLVRTSRTPDRYDVDAAARLLYPAQGICSDAIEEAA